MRKLLIAVVAMVMIPAAAQAAKDTLVIGMPLACFPGEVAQCVVRAPPILLGAFLLFVVCYRWGGDYQGYHYYCCCASCF